MSNAAEHPGCRWSLYLSLAINGLLGCDLMARQCDPCDPEFPCETTCVVSCQSELESALDCLAQGTGCTEIVIPPDCTVDVNSPIGLGASHSGVLGSPNRLSIAGTLRFAGTPYESEKLLNLIGCSHFTFDGGGQITSIYDPESYSTPGDPTHYGIAKAFRIFGDAEGLTIRDLTITNLSTAIEIEGGTAGALTVVNVTVADMVFYGFFSSDRMSASFENCSVDRTLREHAMRLYTVGGNVSVKSCWSYNAAKSGLWMMEGQDVVVDRFWSDRPIMFGPDHGTGSPVGARLYSLAVRDVDCTDVIQVQMGVIGGCLIGLCTDSLNLGRVPSPEDAEPDRPLMNVQWANLSGSAYILDPEDTTDVYEIEDYDACSADINRDLEVDVDDLIAVINAWGGCPQVSGAHPPCPGDIVPAVCGNQLVDVDDLIEVITSWGGCPQREACGDVPPFAGGQPESPPQTVEDCWEKCDTAYPGGGDPWANCFERCLQALEELP